ncbi:hypothetical protein GGR55DRAFT_639522 [Xylaria sp. FL0064]|nr:hypothetical protein GGR55DRAFT_639522 [Xylaria sp. FL0064]
MGSWASTASIMLDLTACGKMSKLFLISVMVLTSSQAAPGSAFRLRALNLTTPRSQRFNIYFLGNKARDKTAEGIDNNDNNGVELVLPV